MRSIKNLVTAKWIAAVAALILGVVGYVQPLAGDVWPWWSSVVLLLAFIVVTVWQWIVEHLESRRSADDFYAQEVTEVFQPADSESRMQFFTDKAGNKSVILMLGNRPIPKSLRLWEGGYHAPPITIAVAGQKVCFRHSGYLSFEEYAKGGPIYQVRYFPALE